MVRYGWERVNILQHRRRLIDSTVTPSCATEKTGSPKLHRLTSRRVGQHYCSHTPPSLHTACLRFATANIVMRFSNKPIGTRRQYSVSCQGYLESKLAWWFNLTQNLNWKGTSQYSESDAVQLATSSTCMLIFLHLSVYTISSAHFLLGRSLGTKVHAGLAPWSYCASVSSYVLVIPNRTNFAIFRTVFCAYFLVFSMDAASSLSPTAPLSILTSVDC